MDNLWDGNYTSSVDFKSINSNKTCHIKSLDYELAFHASAVTPMGIITCGGMSPHYIERKKCFRLSNQNTWESFPSMNSNHNSLAFQSFQMIMLGDILVAYDSTFPDSLRRISHQCCNKPNCKSCSHSRCQQALRPPIKL